jgi:epoxyqueuosine reductase QueG
VLAEDSPFNRVQRLRDATRAPWRALLAMTQEEFSAAFKGSPMKRAKLRGLKRNAEIVLGDLRAAGRTEPLA